MRGKKWWLLGLVILFIVILIFLFYPEEQKVLPIVYEEKINCNICNIDPLNGWIGCYEVIVNIQDWSILDAKFLYPFEGTGYDCQFCLSKNPCLGDSYINEE